jgi:predicted PurR-regulated permease PerM
MVDRPQINISSSTIIRTILFVALAILLLQIKDILMLILVSIVIASFVESGVFFFKRWNIQRQLSVPIIFAVAIVILVAVFYAFVPIVFRELSGVVSLISSYIPSSASIDPQSIKGATRFVSNLSSSVSLKDVLSNVKSVTASLSEGVTAVIGTAFGGVVNLLLVTILSFYFSIQERGIVTFLRIITPTKNEKYVVGLWARTQQKIGLWFKGQMMLGVIVGAVTFIGMAILGLEYSFLIGVVTGIAEIIPFGIIFATIPALLFALIQGGTLLAFKVLIFYVLFHQIESYVLSPMVMRRVVGIPPLVVLLSFMIGITLAGFWGAILAIPVAVFVLEYMSDVEKKKSLLEITENSI